MKKKKQKKKTKIFPNRMSNSLPKKAKNGFHLENKKRKQNKFLRLINRIWGTFIPAQLPVTDG